MVDVSGKESTLREAVAEGWVYLPDSVFEAVSKGDLSKGDPFKVAELAGIMGGKRTPDLIPLCHSIRLDRILVRASLDKDEKAVRIVGEAIAREVTGVEMEALTAVSIAALTFYDMCKGIDKGIRIEGIRLLKKSGGKSGTWEASEVKI